MTNLNAGDRVRIVVNQSESTALQAYDGLVCVVVVVSSPTVLGNSFIRPLTAVPYVGGLDAFYWPSDWLELLPDLSGNVDLASHNAYQFEVLLSDLKCRRREQYTPAAFGELYGESAAWILEFESSEDPGIWDIKRYAMALGVQLDIKLSPVR